MWFIRWNSVILYCDSFIVINRYFICEYVLYVIICFRLFCSRFVVVVKNVVRVFIYVIIISIVGLYLIIGDDCSIRYIFVVIRVVVWIRVDIGVGFFIVFGSYVCRGILVDLVIVLISSSSLIIVIVVLLM